VVLVISLTCQRHQLDKMGWAYPPHPSTPLHEGDNLEIAVEKGENSMRRFGVGERKTSVAVGKIHRQVGVLHHKPARPLERTCISPHH